MPGTGGLLLLLQGTGGPLLQGAGGLLLPGTSGLLLLLQGTGGLLLLLQGTLLSFSYKIIQKHTIQEDGADWSKQE